MPFNIRGSIDICISDNHSSDLTETVVSEFASVSPVNIFYETNALNIAPDVNFIKVVSQSTSDFVWLLGSDDKIAQGGLHYIYNYLVNHRDMDLIFLNKFNYKSGDGKLQRSSGPNVNEEEVIFYTDPLVASLDLVYEAGLISILCFRRLKWRPYQGTRSSLVHGMYINTSIFQ
ncbi:MAG: glycosyltransferase [Candidatus Parvarchaeota archaeon]